MILIENDYVVEKLSSAASNPSLGKPILPGTAPAGSLWLNAAGNQKICHILAEF
jgi:hypothetical protein